ncbi:MAG: hypothetical protein JO252_07880 [Planctomycetaceae bacterium]|nr:hypothetical protein [Planctomycetaceae bacterium]MBV8314578.1 hypothetical protein [Planctomycetaceae bacterium]
MALALSHRRHRLVNLALCWLLPLAAVRAAEGPSPDVTEPPAFGEFLVVPPRDHVLTTPDLPEADCHLSNADLARILGKVNAIWNKARTHRGLGLLIHELAARWETRPGRAGSGPGVPRSPAQAPPTPTPNATRSRPPAIDGTCMPPRHRIPKYNVRDAPRPAGHDVT